MHGLAAIAVTLWASAANATFRPVEDRPYRYETLEMRSVGSTLRRFHVHRAVVFHRTATGFTASVTLEAIDQQGGGDVGRMFMAATGALLHHMVRYRLDPTGGITEVEDADAVIALIADAIERMDPPNTVRRESSKSLASPLRLMPAERKAAMLRSILTPIIAGVAADQPVGEHPVTVPSRPPLPADTALAGTESVSSSTTGIITIDLQAQGGIAVTASPDAPGAAIARPITAPTATLHLSRNVDPATGLVRDSREISETMAVDGATSQRTRTETVITLTLAA